MRGNLTVKFEMCNPKSEIVSTQNPDILIPDILQPDFLIT